MKIEFFHDVICSFCFPMSYRMRQLQKERPDIEIIHRSFALVKDPQDFSSMFGSREAAKAEIMTHWHHANQNDDLHRFNITGMEAQEFLFPSSTNGLLAVMAAKRLGGSTAYWDLFDALQEGLFVNNRNIEDVAVIEDIVLKTGLDLVSWRVFFRDEHTAQLVQEDLKLVTQYQLAGAPALVINGHHHLSGARSLAQIKQAIAEIEAKEASHLTELNVDQAEGSACRMEDGKIVCD